MSRDHRFKPTFVKPQSPIVAAVFSPTLGKNYLKTYWRLFSSGSTHTEKFYNFSNLAFLINSIYLNIHSEIRIILNNYKQGKSILISQNPWRNHLIVILFKIVVVHSDSHNCEMFINLTQNALGNPLKRASRPMCTILSPTGDHPVTSYFFSKREIGKIIGNEWLDELVFSVSKIVTPCSKIAH